jgi:indole-3-glycerol phosphate synthase
MNILEMIINHKKNEVEERKSLYPTKLLERSIYFNSPTVSLKKYLLRTDKVGIISEIKRKSPSKGIINKYISIEKVSIGYMQAGSSALSILTDEKFFGGQNEDLTIARKFNFCPILRKDFIIDEYQIIESKSIGADTILLIGKVLETKKIEELAKFAKSLGLEVLLEINEKEELESSLNEYIDIVGVNNRNLNDFSVSINQSVKLSEYIPKNFLKISESGITSAKDVYQLKSIGYNGFLIGELFMQSSRPEKACRNFIKHIVEFNII